jgi:hypothetical protein
MWTLYKLLILKEFIKEAMNIYLRKLATQDRESRVGRYGE